MFKLNRWIVVGSVTRFLQLEERTGVSSYLRRELADVLAVATPAPYSSVVQAPIGLKPCRITAVIRIPARKQIRTLPGQHMKERVIGGSDCTGQLDPPCSRYFSSPHSQSKLSGQANQVGMRRSIHALRPGQNCGQLAFGTNDWTGTLGKPSCLEWGQSSSVNSNLNCESILLSSPS